MSSTPEGKVKEKIREVLRKHHVHYNHIAASRFGKAGAADYLCCVNGAFLAVEAKSKGGGQTDLQKIEEESIKNAGGVYIVIHETNLKELDDCIVQMKYEDRYERL